MIKSENAVKIAKNTVFQVIGKVISMVVTVVVTMVVAQYFGREGYGEFSLMQSWPALFFVIVDFGINAVAVRELTKKWEDANKYIGNVLLFRVVFSLALVLLLGLSG